MTSIMTSIESLTEAFNNTCNISDKNVSNNVNVHFNITDEYVKISCNIQKPIEDNPLKKWIKEIDIHKELSLYQFKQSDQFKLVANIELDQDITAKGSKKRNTVIKFNNVVSKEEWEQEEEYIYIFTINGKIVKIGGTRTGLKSRCASYLCGHHIPERGKSGDCSKTNAYIYNTFEFYLQNGYKIQMYGFKLPSTEVKVRIIDEDVIVKAQTYHAYESIIMQKYKSQCGHIPVLCDNSDPNYK